MDIITINRKQILWVVFLTYLGLLAILLWNHEPWGDELHSWNIAKCSPNLFELFTNIRYEGHPPLWYILLWLVAQCSHNFLYVQVLHGVLASICIGTLLFYSPFPQMARILLPFGYYFLFEYATLSRNYVLGILCGMCLCLLWNREFKGKSTVYYVLLGIMAQTHLLAALLGFSLHVAKGYEIFLTQGYKKACNHFFIGSLVFIPIIYFLVPPKDSGLNTDFWFSKVGIEHIFLLIQAPLKASFPLPAWWEHHFWNTQWLLFLHKSYGWLKPVNAIISVSIFGLLAYVFSGHRASFILFCVNVICTFIFGIVFPLSSARYVGFFWISCVFSSWLFYEKNTPTRFGQMVGMVLLTFQLLSSFFVVPMEIQHPFSQSKSANQLMALVPKGIPLVTDYWSFNTLSLVDKPSMYCLDLQEERCFLEWNQNLTKIALHPDKSYSKGTLQFFEKEKCVDLYLITSQSQTKLNQLDPTLFQTYFVEFVAGTTESIERNSDLYLFKIKKVEN